MAKSKRQFTPLLLNIEGQLVMPLIVSCHN